MATEITFEQIAQFIKYCDTMTEKARTFNAALGRMQDKTGAFGFHPVILMSLDMERYLRERAGVKFAKDVDGRLYFCGIPIINIIADGYLSFCWEANEP